MIKTTFMIVITVIVIIIKIRIRISHYSYLQHYNPQITLSLTSGQGKPAQYACSAPRNMAMNVSSSHVFVILARIAYISTASSCIPRDPYLAGMDHSFCTGEKVT